MLSFCVKTLKKKSVVLALTCFIVLFLTTLPYFLVLKFDPYSLGSIDGASSDINTYLADMQEGFQGRWCYLNPYTSEEHPCEYLFLFYLFLGHIARKFSLSLPLTYTLAKIPAIIFLLLVSWWFCGLFLKDFKKRFFAFLAICFSSGLGWIIFVPPNLYDFLWTNFKTLFLPTDIWLAEAATFLLLLGPPHFAFGHSFLHLSLGLFLKLWTAESSRKKLLYLLLIVLTTHLMVVMHPYITISFVVLVWGFIGVFSFVFKKLDRRNLVVAVILTLSLVPITLYHYKALNFNPVMQGWTAQNILLSPFPLSYILGFGLVFIFALRGMSEIGEKIDTSNLFLFCYPVFNFLLLYSPFNFQLKFTEGLHVPLCILATNGFFVWKEKFNFPEKKKIIALLVYLSVIGNVGIWGNILLSLGPVFKRELKVYAAHEEQAFTWLSSNTLPDETVLAAFNTGNTIPIYAGNRVYLGHAHITPDAKLKKEKVKQFFQGGKLEREKYFLESNNIRYIFFGKEEKKLTAVPIDERLYLEKVFESGDISIYEVLEN